MGTTSSTRRPISAGYIFLACILAMGLGFGLWTTGLPLAFVVLLGAVAGIWSVLVLHGARRAQAHETGQALAALPAADAVRLFVTALAIWLVVALGGLAVWRFTR